MSSEGRSERASFALQVLVFVLRRLLSAVPLLLALSLATFFLLFHSPGDFLSGLRLDPKIPKAFLDAEVARLGLNKPWYEIWWRWVVGLLQGNFGHSFSYKIPVSDLIGERIFATFLLAFTSTLFSWLIAVPLGIVAAVKRDQIPDRFASFVAFVGLSIPSVLLALFAIMFAAWSGWFPVQGMRSDSAYAMTSFWERTWDITKHLALPTVVLGMAGLATYTRQMRSNLLETLSSDYVRTAYAKGVRARVAILKHAVPNALNPMITLFGLAFADLLSGAFLVENIFAWPGLGRTTIEALNSKDMFVVASTTLMAAVMLVIGNLIADLLLLLNDPRMKYD